MGKACAWCGTILRALVGTSVPSAHALCHGCLEDLRTALSTHGLRPSDRGNHPH